MTTNTIDVIKMHVLQHRRRLLQLGFFITFILAPPLDLLRVDVTRAHVIVFGQVWDVGINALLAGEQSGGQTVLSLIVRGFVPLATVVLLFGWMAWRYGRLYCGWLCPHYSVVELINGLMRRASGKPNVWEKHALPRVAADGHALPLQRNYWWLAAAAIIGFAFVWALVLLTYLLPPAEIYGNLVQAELTRNQTIFLSVATTVFALEFFLARHLFCRFGCAVGVFQSLVWMGNRKAMVIGFDRERAAECRQCDSHCDHVCPMRLKPRTSKRHMFTCTQCGQCLTACAEVQTKPGRPPLLQWVQGACALDTSAREFGHHPPVPKNCYRR